MGRGQGIQAAGSHTRRGFVTVAGSDGIKWEVRPGVFDDDAREACVLGQCHALALALNRRFSWPLVGAFLQRQRREQMLLRLNEVYAGGMEPAETAPLKGIKAKVRRAVKERWGARFGRDKCTGSHLALRPARRP